MKATMKIGHRTGKQEVFSLHRSTFVIGCLAFTVTFLLLKINFLTAQDILAHGVYQGKNLLVQNPFSATGVGFCVTSVEVNGKICDSVGINTSAFEIDFRKEGIRPGDKVIVTIHHKAGCKPIVLNPEALSTRTSDMPQNTTLTSWQDKSGFAASKLTQGTFYAKNNQTCLIIGKVVDEKTGNPVGQVNVDLIRADQSGYLAVTSPHQRNGTYLITVVPGAVYELSIEAGNGFRKKVLIDLRGLKKEDQTSHEVEINFTVPSKKENDIDSLFSKFPVAKLFYDINDSTLKWDTMYASAIKGMINTMNRRISEKQEFEMQKQKRDNELQQASWVRKIMIVASTMLLIIIILVTYSLVQSRKARKLITQQKLLIEEKQKEVIDSINYAKRIQQSQLPTEKYIGRVLSRIVSRK